MDSFKQNLKQDLNTYLQTNSNYNRVHQQLQELREMKMSLEQQIVEYLKENDQEHKVFVLNDVKVQHKSYISYQNLSIKFLESCLLDYNNQYQTELPIKDLLQFIKNKRDKRQKDELRITNT
jgi:ribonuclease HIII|tara:strand:+ start:59 stop:424 length:366 start_codon:yes stop_codon:yes gene_type:complete